MWHKTPVPSSEQNPQQKTPVVIEMLIILVAWNVVGVSNKISIWNKKIVTNKFGVKKNVLKIREDSKLLFRLQAQLVADIDLLSNLFGRLGHSRRVYISPFLNVFSSSSTFQEFQDHC